MGDAYEVCVVVPTFNEAENVRALVEGVKANLAGAALLFVDDSSPDGTSEVIAEIAKSEPWVRLKSRAGKMGIGSAYQDGFREAIAALSPAIVVEMDADLQHPPSVLPRLVGAVRAGADVAVGSRYVPGGGAEGWGLWRRAVSRGANAYARAALRLSVKDVTSGFRAYTRAAAEEVATAGLPARGFEFQVAALKALKTNTKTVEVPYTFTPRRSGKSKLGLGDMARFFVAVLRLAF